MSDSKPTQFTYTAGQAGVIQIAASDGKTYTVNVGLIVFSVSEAANRAPDGTPEFEIRAAMQFDKVPVKP